MGSSHDARPHPHRLPPPVYTTRRMHLASAHAMLPACREGPHAPVRLSADVLFYCRGVRPAPPQCPAPLPFSNGTSPSCALNRASSLRYSASAFSSNSYGRVSNR